MKENGLSREIIMAFNFPLRTPKERCLLKSSSALRIIILNLILQSWNKRVWIGFNCLSLGSNGEKCSYCNEHWASVEQ